MRRGEAVQLLAVRRFVVGIVALMSALAFTEAFAHALAYRAQRIVGYNTSSTIDSTVLQNPAHWGYWDSTVEARGAAGPTGDDTMTPPFAGICPAVFSTPSTPLFVDTNGFLGLAPYSMCGLFCRGDYSVSSLLSWTDPGYYQFNATYGGDWPLIALWAHDLNPVYAGSVITIASNAAANATDPEGSTSVTVQYYNVPTYGNSTPPSLRAQAQVYRNGTIIFRYLRVPRTTGSPFAPSPSDGPAVGVSFGTENYFQRISLEVPSIDVQSAIRLDPITDPCDAYSYTTCGNCLSMNGTLPAAGGTASSYDSADGCVWCPSTGICASPLTAATTSSSPTGRSASAQGTGSGLAGGTTQGTAGDRLAAAVERGLAAAGADADVPANAEALVASLAMVDAAFQSRATVLAREAAAAATIITGSGNSSTSTTATALTSNGQSFSAGHICGTGGDTVTNLEQCAWGVAWPVFVNNSTAESGNASAAAGAEIEWPQAFYSTRVYNPAGVDNASLPNADYAAANDADGKLLTESMVSVRDLAGPEWLFRGGYSSFTGPIHVSLKTFAVTVFDFPANKSSGTNGSDTPDDSTWTTVTSFYLQRNGAVTFRTSTPTGDCTSGYCAGGAYGTPALLPFASTMALDATVSNVLTLELAERAPLPSSGGSGGRVIDNSNAFCNQRIAAANAKNPGFCPPAIVVQVENLRPTSGQASTNVAASVQFMIDESGAVAVRLMSLPSGGSARADAQARAACRTTPSAFVYPRAYVGMILSSADDGSSAVVAQHSFGVGSVALFTPVRGCGSCLGNGWCDFATNQCVCYPAFAGANCSECAPGYFGENCVACDACHNGGVCDAGRTGTGSCLCTGAWSGEFCDVQCSSAAAAACSDCSLRGGICTCGKCACRSSEGWGGASCAVWTDPCDQSTLDGCPTCLAATPYRALSTTTGKSYYCAYCTDADAPKCATSLASLPPRVPSSYLTTCAEATLTRVSSTEYTVTGSSDTASTAKCTSYQYATSTSTDFNLLLAVTAFVLLVVMAIIGVVVVCCCRRIPLNPYLTSAIVGVPNFRRLRREREVMQIRLMDPDREGLVQALPLRQISLAELYRWQRFGGPVPAGAEAPPAVVSEAVAAAAASAARRNGPIPAAVAVSAPPVATVVPHAPTPSDPAMPNPIASLFPSVPPPPSAAVSVGASETPAAEMDRAVAGGGGGSGVGGGGAATRHAANNDDDEDSYRGNTRTVEMVGLFVSPPPPMPAAAAHGEAAAAALSPLWPPRDSGE